ncbi:MAG: hypothetical protein ACLPQI_00580 [Steroidobacteraceae bacterium]
MASSLLDRVKRPPPSAETFIAAADAPPSPSSSLPETRVEAVKNMPPATIAKARPAQRGRDAPGEDPRKHDVPRYTFNLRLNDYELELLRSLAEEQRESMQKIVKNGLIPYLEELRQKGG